MRIQVLKSKASMQCKCKKKKFEKIRYILGRVLLIRF